jgi:hypothetical protein
MQHRGIASSRQGRCPGFSRPDRDAALPVSPLKGFLLILAALLCFSENAFAEQPLQMQTENFFSLPLDGTITIDHGDGSIHIFGWYQPRVRLATLRKAYTKARLSQIEVATIAKPASLDIRTIIPKAPGFFADRSGTIDYTLNVPETARLNLKLGNGEISLQGLRGGNAAIDFMNGRLLAINCFAKVRAHSVNGVMEVFFEWWENLPATFNYVLERGRIGARLPAVAQFRADAATASGGIENGFGFKKTYPGNGEALKASTATSPSISLFLRTGGGNISIDRGG